MIFSFLKNEKKDVIDLINKVFNKNAKEDLFYLQPNQRFLLLKDRNIVIGTTLITEKYDPINGVKSFYLDYVCISEEYRGKGLGEKMLKEIEKIAKEEHIKRIELTSNKKRVCARNLYQKWGMEVVDTDLFSKNI